LSRARLAFAQVRDGAGQGAQRGDEVEELRPLVSSRTAREGEETCSRAQPVAGRGAGRHSAPELATGSVVGTGRIGDRPAGPTFSDARGHIQRIGSGVCSIGGRRWIGAGKAVNLSGSELGCSNCLTPRNSSFGSREALCRFP
jgi:hypothetical protein